MKSTANRVNGRTAAGFSARLKEQIASGRLAPGEFLPSVRQLSKDHGLSCKTVHRALKSMAAAGLVIAEPRQGYRVLPGAGDPDRGAPLAYICKTTVVPEQWTPRFKTQVNSFQRAASRRGWSMLSVTAEHRTVQQMVEQALTARACGAILDTEDLELIDEVSESGMPAVMVDAWLPEGDIDSVMQDGNHGGQLAAGYLASRGHKRIAWFGPRISDAHSTDRFGGTASGLARVDLALPAGMRIVISKDEDEIREKTRALLSGKNRPTGIVCLWTSMGPIIYRAAREMGLEHGRDYEMVCWSTEELYDSHYRPAFGDGPVPPAVTWSVDTMAETTMIRLAERRENPKMPTLRVKIPTRLRLAE